MNAGFFVLLSLSLFFFSSSGAARRDRRAIDCKDYMDDGMYCTRESDPHCGTDGMTYGNKCAFCKAVKKSQGSIGLRHIGKC
nr:serine protease inhibitor Kazal-type 6 isoform X1 [Pelodiscus sinensis]|eukprot:XP_006110270.1 serine protease inhibitor Kazal-type 6 isoform X1 [Pelodiscus sinensis]